MFCSKCGKEIDDSAVVCIHCGCSVEKTQQPSYVPVTDAPSEVDTGEKPTLANCAMAFAFLMPIIGLILGIVGIVKYKNEKYKKQCVVAIPVSIVVWIIVAFIMMAG